MIKGVWSPAELSLCDETLFVVCRMQCVWFVCVRMHLYMMCCCGVWTSRDISSRLPLIADGVAAGSTFPLRLCLLNNVPSRLIMNNISSLLVVPFTFFHLTMIKMPSAHHLSFPLSFYIFHRLFFFSSWHSLPPSFALLSAFTLFSIHS